jgi:hypothetical protein
VQNVGFNRVASAPRSNFVRPMVGVFSVAVLFVGFMRTKNGMPNSVVLNSTAGCGVFVVTHGSPDFGMELVGNNANDILVMEESHITYV